MRTHRALPLGLAALLLAGCADGRRDAVRADYLGFWDAYLGARAAADPEHGDLAARAGGTLLETLRTNLVRAKEDRVVGRGTVGHDIRRVAVRGDRAEVLDCVDLDSVLLYDQRTGDLVPNQLTDRPSQLVEYTLEQVNGSWVAMENRVVGEC